MRALLLFVLLLTPPASAQDRIFADSFEKETIFFIYLQITVIDDGQVVPSDLNILFAEMVQLVWKVASPAALAGTNVYDVCSDGQGGAVDTVQEISSNYKTELTAQQQFQFSSDPEYFADFVNDSNGNLLVCDPEETDGKYVKRYVLSIVEV